MGKNSNVSEIAIALAKKNSRELAKIAKEMIYRENLLDDSAFVDNTGLSSTGDTVFDGTKKCTDFIAVTPNTTYYRITTNATLIAYYDVNKEFISRPTIGASETSFTTPSNAYYCKYSNLKANMALEVFAKIQPYQFIAFNSPKYELKYSSPLRNKKIAIFGDSISYGETLADRTTQNYPSLLKSRYGIITSNNAISGASWQTDGVNDALCILTQIANSDLSNTDIALIFAGTNDFGRGGMPIGTISDTVTNTLYGAINNAISNIITKKPDIRIGIVTPMWRQRQAPGDNKDSDIYPINTRYLLDYVNAIIACAKANHVPFLDLYSGCVVNKYNYSTFLSDGLHPNIAGHSMLCDKIHSFACSI